MEPFPASPEPEYRPDAKGPAPASVLNAVKLIWVSVGLSLISTVLTFTMIDDLVDQAIENAGGGVELDRDAARAGVMISLAVGVVIGVALAAMFAYFIGKGANWARIVYTVLGVIGVLFGLMGLGNQPALLLVLSIISTLLTIATIFLLFRPESNAYFKKA